MGTSLQTWQATRASLTHNQVGCNLLSRDAQSMASALRLAAACSAQDQGPPCQAMANLVDAAVLCR